MFSDPRREIVNKRYIVKLSKEERESLLLVDTGKKGPGWNDEAIATACNVTVRTVENVRKRLVLEGLEEALNRKKQVRPSRCKVFDGEKEAKLVALCCGTAPSGHARWTLRLLAERVVELQIAESVSHETVRRCLKKTN
jgi:hypothetical protein